MTGRAGKEERAFCKECGRWPLVTKTGRLAKHDYPQPWGEDDPQGVCKGSGRPAGATQPSLLEEGTT